MPQEENVSEQLLRKRDKDSFDEGFAAGQDWTELAKDYARGLVSQAVADRIDDAWLVRARDFLSKTSVE